MKTSLLCAFALTTAVASAIDAATFEITATETGGNVVINGTGSLDLTGAIF